MSLDISGIAIVTGAGSGIGRDCALGLAAAGARAVVFADINLEAAKDAAMASSEFATNPNYSELSLAVDVTDISSVIYMVDTCLERYGRIDYLVNSAGLGVKKPAEVAEADLQEFDDFYRVNVKGTLHCIREVSHVMREQTPLEAVGRNGPRIVGRGSIVNIASLNSFLASPGIVQYTTSKHAMLGLTRSAALDNASYGIRVNAVCPSWVQTPMVDAALEGNPPLKDAIQHMIPLGRIAQVEEVSDVVVFLASPKSSYVNGVGWPIDGGLLSGRAL